MFGDVYFSKANGLEETRHVFLQYNQLHERWQQLPDNAFFTIGETGFGSGLNFLATWQLWEQTAPATARLHFVTVEKFPLSRNDLAKALALWPELSHYAQALIEAYPEIIGESIHRLKFADNRISLTLIINDAACGFEQLLASTHPLFRRTGCKVDAWFLDGFAPSKNPAMWSPELFAAISDLSQSGTTAATFSAAALVKNGLKSAGFTIQKVPGYGKKREMVKAKFSAPPQEPQAEDYLYKGSFSPYPVPWTISQKPAQADRIAVIGAGLAGCHTARQLAERGYEVTVFERHTGAAQEGSGNPQGALYAKLSPLNEAQAAFNLASLQYAMGFYEPLWPHIGQQTGLLQLAYKPAEVKLHQELVDKYSKASRLVEFVDAHRASEIAGIPLSYGGLYFPEAGWINPKSLCDQLLSHPRITVKYCSLLIDLKRENNSWILGFEDQVKTQFPLVVLACAASAKQLNYCNNLPIKRIRGQVSYLPNYNPSQTINTVVCAEGYISPPQNNTYCTGATFNLGESDLTTTLRDHQTNLHNLQQQLPQLAAQWNVLDLTQIEGRAAFRCSFPDYLPAVGPIADELAMIEQFAPLRKNARAGIVSPGCYLPGLFLNIGHGARGLAYTPLCAELLASHITGEPLPISQTLANALNPARFLIRDITRNKR